MKKKILLILCLSAGTIAFAQQKTSFGAKAGTHLFGNERRCS
ncbi:MAG: hypothetical protein V9E88_00285 [Ferruginibacter sp.]